MMQTLLLIFLLFSTVGLEAVKFTIVPDIQIKQVKLKKYPNAFNPSIIRWKEGFLLAFRHLPNSSKLWISQMGLVPLDENFEQAGPVQILNLREGNSEIPCQGEDARMIIYNDKLYLIYNDNMEKINPTHLERRDMHLAEVACEGGKFRVMNIQKLYHSKDYKRRMWQKNWSPFVYKDSLCFSYSMNPHEVLALGENGECERINISAILTDWKWGAWRGGTPAELVDGEYLAFFHSSSLMRSEATPKYERWHYFMGAYTFSAEPPFNLTNYTPYPIIGEGFYTRSLQEKRVVFPGGFVVHEDKIHIAFGKDDNEMWIATIEKSKLKELLVPIEETSN